MLTDGDPPFKKTQKQVAVAINSPRFDVPGLLEISRPTSLEFTENLRGFGCGTWEDRAWVFGAGWDRHGLRIADLIYLVLPVVASS